MSRRVSLVTRLHVDLRRQASALCRPGDTKQRPVRPARETS
ncbi:putative leader peptide [Actinomadura rubrisoli]